MNLNKIKELLEIVSMLDGDKPEEAKPQSENFTIAVGKYVICRSRNEGVNFGKVVSYENGRIHLVEARRLHWFKPAHETECWYEGVAEHGVSSDSRLSAFSEKEIVEDYSITICSDKSVKNIMEHKPHEQQ